MVYVSHTKIAAKVIIKSTLWLFFKKKIPIIRYRVKFPKNNKNILLFFITAIKHF